MCSRKKKKEGERQREKEKQTPPHDLKFSTKTNREMMCYDQGVNMWSWLGVGTQFFKINYFSFEKPLLKCSKGTMEFFDRETNWKKKIQVD